MRHGPAPILFTMLLALPGLILVDGWLVRADEGTDSSGQRTQQTESRQAQWSLQALPQLDPLKSVDQPDGLQPIDRYIHRKLNQQELACAKRAPPHRQVRRLSLLLTGLPPDPAIIHEFASEPTAENYAHLVDHYLQSPHFGERWARHWMDVVRFAETYGYEWNFLIRDAWRYRDYLIRAFNQDLPYDQLIREHIAGDLIPQPRLNHALGINESIIGTAFYRFGETGHDDCTIYPEIGLDVLDNQIDTLTKAFQAMTVSCAKCHDHKLDAIPQQDYYALLGIMASSKQVIHTLNLPGHQAQLKQDLSQLKRQIRQEMGRLWLETANHLSANDLDAAATFLEQRAIDKQAGHPSPLDRVEHPLFLWTRTTKLEAGKSWHQPWDELGQQLRQEHDRRCAFNQDHFTVFADFSAGPPAEWAVAGSAAEHGFAQAGDFSIHCEGDFALDQILPAGFYSHLISQKINATVRSPLVPRDKTFVSYQVIGENNSACRTVIDDCQLAFFHTNWLNQPTFAWLRSSKVGQAKFRAYLEWTTLFDNQGFPNLKTPDAEYRESLDNPRSYFGITKVLLHDEPAEPLPELAPQLLLIEQPVERRQALAARYRNILREAVTRWSHGEASETDVFWINFFLQVQILTGSHDASEHLHQLVHDYRSLETRLETSKLIVGLADQGSGFDLPVFDGGDPESPAEIAPRAYLTCLGNVVKPTDPLSGSGRAAIAEIIAHPDNPLTARVMANRIWHHLFGTGLVKTVDNFGAIGDMPTHPELLDYLARRFIDSGWSVKRLIREIVLSETFRQDSTVHPSASLVDPENILLHHYPSRRLEAEVIRDSLLAVSGRLDLQMYGPSVDPHRSEIVEKRRLFTGPLDGDGRRSLYLKVTRMGPPKFLALFNFPDPGMTLGRRDSTNVPAQALGMLNHPFVHQQAQRHAQKLLQRSNRPFAEYVDELFLTLLGRRPSETELSRCEELFAQLSAAEKAEPEHRLRDVIAWKNFIHALYNLKEFIYVL